MKSFLEGGQTARSVKVRGLDGAWKKRGTGTADVVTADAMADMIESLMAKHAWDVLDKIVAKSLSVADCYARWVMTPARKNPRNNAPIEPSNDERLQYVRDMLNVVDLDAIVAKWAAQKGTDAKYVIQVRALIPAGVVFPLSDYTTPRLSKHIKTELGVGENTMRRYKAAHSAFGKHLKELGHLTTNPVRDVDLPTLPDAEPIFLEMPDAERLIRSYGDDEAEQRALEALMAGSMIEMGGCAMLRRRDVDVKRRTVMVHPTDAGRFKNRKNRNRSRPVDVTEEFAWQIFYEHIRYMHPDAFVFPSTPPNDNNANGRVLRRHQTQCRNLGLLETTLHQYRHTFAVTWIDRGVLGDRRDGKDLNWLRDQAGHARNSMEIQTNYGVRIKQYEKRRDVDRAQETGT